MDSNLWRLMLDPPSDGARNMAVDEALLEETAAGRSLPTLRLYAWDPPTLSLGFAQPAADCDREALKRLGWGLVRRPTGGRAILHTDELTYSITAPESHPLMQGGVLESYRRLSLGLLAGLRLLGVDVQADPGQRGRAAGNPVCFEIPSQYEISAGGRKLIGSAQARRLGGVLQHGAFPLRRRSAGRRSRRNGCAGAPRHLPTCSGARFPGGRRPMPSSAVLRPSSESNSAMKSWRKKKKCAPMNWRAGNTEAMIGISEFSLDVVFPAATHSLEFFKYCHKEHKKHKVKKTNNSSVPFVFFVAI
jgi:lipoate-protein ligase A